MKKTILYFCFCISLFAKGQTLQWGKAFGSASDDRASSIAVDENNNVVVAGFFSDTIHFDSFQSNQDRISKGNFDVFVAKYDSTGQLLWTISIGGIDGDNVKDLKIDKNNNIYLTGSFSPSSLMDTVIFSSTDTSLMFITNTSAGTEGFILKLDSSGNVVFLNIISGTTGRDLFVDESSNVYWAGMFGGNVDFDPSAGQYIPVYYGDGDAFIASYDSLGNFRWVKTMGQYNDDDLFYSVQVNKAGYIYAAGHFIHNSDLDPDSGSIILPCNWDEMIIAKYNNNGGFIWAKQFCGFGQAMDLSIMIDSTSNIITIGRIDYPVDFDPSGNSFILYPQSQFDLFVAKYDSSGNFISAVLPTGASGVDIENSLFVERSGDFILTGIAGHTDIDLTQDSIIILSTSGHNNFFISQYNANNNLTSWLVTGSASGSVRPTCVVKDNSGNYYGAGYFGNYFCLTPNCTNAEYYSNGSLDCFVAKYNTLPFTVGVKEIYPSLFSLFPNPATNTFTLKNISSSEIILLEIADVHGEIVYKEKLFGKNECVINTNLEKGIYFVRVNDVVRKLIVE